MTFYDTCSTSDIQHSRACFLYTDVIFEPRLFLWRPTKGAVRLGVRTTCERRNIFLITTRKSGLFSPMTASISSSDIPVPRVLQVTLVDGYDRSCALLFLVARGTLAELSQAPCLLHLGDNVLRAWELV